MRSPHAQRKRAAKMRRRSGRVVVVASLAAFVGMAGFSTYCPTKFALRGLADALRSEVRRAAGCCSRVW